MLFAEFAYFRLLHELLPEPFFQTQPFLIFFAVVGTVCSADPVHSTSPTYGDLTRHNSLPRMVSSAIGN